MSAFRLLLLAFLLVTTFAGPVFGQRIDWIRSTIRGASEDGFVDKVAVDPGGNSYVAGLIADSVVTSLATLYAPPRVQPGGLNTGGSYLLRYNAVGQAQWGRQLKGAYVWDIDADAQGNAYLIGRNDSSAEFDATTTLALPGVFMARFDAAGLLQWVTPVRLPADPLTVEARHSLQVDATGNIYMQTWWVNGVMMASATDSVNQVPLATPGVLDAVVAGFNPSGVAQWAGSVTRRRPDASGNTPVGLARLTTDKAGNCYLLGNSLDTLYFHQGGNTQRFCLPLFQNTFDDGRGFMVKLDAAGTVTQLIETDRRDPLPGNFISVAPDAAGNVYLVNLNTAAGPRILKYSTTSDSLWSRPVPSLDPFQALGTIASLVVTSDNQLVMTGATAAGNAFSTVIADTELTWSQIRAEGMFNDPLAQGNGDWARIETDTLGNAYVLAENHYTPVNRFAYGPGYVHGWGSTLIKLNPQRAQLSGLVYLDANANGRRDAGEPPFPRPVLVSETARPYSTMANPAIRQFTVFADTGAYTLTLPAVPTHYVLTQGAAGYTGHLRAYGQTDTARTFGLAPIANRADVRVTLTPLTAARRGFANRYRVRVENVGTTTASGQATVQLDALIPYVGATPPPATHTTSAATWNFQSLPPFGHVDYLLAGTVPLNVPLDTILTSSATATIANDFDPTNNTEVVPQRVVGSYDPNDLTVNYTTLTPAQIAAQTPLDYTIRFQNMGTDTAFTVVITDTLPADLLRMGTLQLVSASHNCWWDVLDQRHLVVRFDRINLPDHNTNSLGSLGFVRFRVLPQATLMPGARIPNAAHITFDYNAPLATNNVTTLVQNPTGLPHEPGATALSLYPNPTTAHTVLTATLPTAGTVEVLLLDALGRPVRRAAVSAPAGAWQHRLATNGLAPGVYVVRLALPDGATVSRRLVVQ